MKCFLLLLFFSVCVGRPLTNCRDIGIFRICTINYTGIEEEACKKTLKEKDCFIFHCLHEVVKCDYTSTQLKDLDSVSPTTVRTFTEPITPKTIEPTGNTISIIFFYFWLCCRGSNFRPSIWSVNINPVRWFFKSNLRNVPRLDFMTIFISI